MLHVLGSAFLVVNQPAVPLKPFLTAVERAERVTPAPAQLILQSDKAEPILARWRAGIGWAIAWTSDLKNLWAVEWLRWQGYGQFWGQLVHEHMRKKHRRDRILTL